jgi:arginine decarboxylase
MSRPQPGDPGAIPTQYDAVQLRMDTWNRLRVSASWLHEFARAERDHDEPRRAVLEGLETLRCLETCWAYPGPDAIEELGRSFARRDYGELARRVGGIVRELVGGAYRTRAQNRRGAEDRSGERRERGAGEDGTGARPYFEVLFVDSAGPEQRQALRDAMLAVQRDEDEFVYDIVFVPSFEDAVITTLFNRTIQACVLLYNFPFQSGARHPLFRRYLDLMDLEKPAVCYGLARSLELGRVIKALRPEVDLFLVTDTPLEEVAGNLGLHFRRTFYRYDQNLELHLSIIKAIRSRYETPFFDALRRYSQRPTGVFHALPIARGKSINNGHWVQDLLQFYGSNIFLAETSSTSGGLDSLLQPHGPIKRAQEMAARAFGARHTFFATNGTSTANKIVVQGLTRPGDIVLLSRDCHKSHHYALMLAGAHPVYLDAYPLAPYTMYGGVPLSEIKRRLLDLRRAGRLDRVRMVLLTNCTFDGITYDPLRVMREVLAIKPDVIFVWDEAWFAFAGFDPLLRRRTAMWAAARLRDELRSPAYRAKYDAWKAAFDKEDQEEDATWLEGPLLPDPDAARVRVYATQSTHKTLTALRQGSMIHVYDEDFEQKASGPFSEAFMTHTSTSPNYQIIASLDVGRRQVELEGYELVQKSVGVAMTLRERIYDHPLISHLFSVLRPADLIPARYRPSGLEFYYDPVQGWGRMEEAWQSDEFTLDPTRVTVHIGKTGLDGDTFRHLLMDEHDIQINKTSRNTVLFMTNIGTSRGDVAYLIEVLAKITQRIEDRLATESEVDRRRHNTAVSLLTECFPPLPRFSRFHAAFAPSGPASPEGDLRRAFFLAYDDEACEYLKLEGPLGAALAAGREVVSASFVTPYPPGFPVLVPGQVVSSEILEYLNAVDVKEIHGYRPEHGLRVFTEAALAAAEVAEAVEDTRRLTE